MAYSYYDAPTIEHAYQLAKTLCKSERVWVLSSSTPAEARKRGQEVTKREDWESVRIDIMRELLRQKFQIPEFKEKLLATGEAELIEGNWWGDTFWGVCKGVGENNLGKLIMEIREEIRCRSLSMSGLE